MGQDETWPRNRFAIQPSTTGSASLRHTPTGALLLYLPAISQLACCNSAAIEPFVDLL